MSIGPIDGDASVVLSAIAEVVKELDKMDEV